MPVLLNLDNLKFPATAVPSADPNTLDDYEEGVWTPGLALATSGSVTYNGTYVFAGSGRYTKIGRLVHIQCIIILSALASPTGAVTLTGLPFPAAAGTTNYLAVSVLAASLNAAITSMASGRIAPGASAIDLYKPAAGGGSPLLGADLTATSEFYVSATYTIT